MLIARREELSEYERRLRNFKKAILSLLNLPRDAEISEEFLYTLLKERLDGNREKVSPD